MTKEEAEAKLKAHKNKPLGYCPLINGMCRKDCVSYIKARITCVYANTYVFYPEECGSPLITGAIDTYQQ